MPQIIPPRVPLVDQRTGMVSVPWYRFFSSWFDQTGGYTGVIPATSGGTGFSSYTTGDILYASSTTAFSRLNDVATGNALISGGVGAAPSWGKINLGTHVTGTLLAAQFPALTGDVTTSAGSLATTLATVNSDIGTYNNVTVNGKGLVTAASNVSYLTGNQTITLSGDATGSGATAITVTLKSVGTAGTYTKVTTDAQGRVSAGATAAASDLSNGTTGSGSIVLATAPTIGTGDAFLGQRIARLTADYSITSNTTLADVTGMACAIAANEEWVVSFDLQAAAALSTTGMAVAITVPTGATLDVGVYVGPAFVATTGQYYRQTQTSGGSLEFTTANLTTTNRALVRIDVWVLNGANAGDIQLQAAQSTSSGTALTFRKGSFMRADRVA